MMFVQLQLEQTKEKNRNKKRSHQNSEGSTQPMVFTSTSKIAKSSAAGAAGSSNSKASSSQQSTSRLTPPTPTQNQPDQQSGSTGAKFTARRNYTQADLSRLRRMCPSHNPCVVYSNRELASEIKSIVSHGGQISNSSQGKQSSINPRMMHIKEPSQISRDGQTTPVNPAGQSPNQKAAINKPSTSKCEKTNSDTNTSAGSRPPSNQTHAKSDHAQPGSSSGPSSSGLQVRPIAKPSSSYTVSQEKAYIDSFTTHGPGIFSGTFSGKFNHTQLKKLINS